MRRPLLVLAVLATVSGLAPPAHAQVGSPPDAQVVYNEGVAALVPVGAYDRPADDRVWTDMRPLAFKGSDEELQAATGATLYAGPAPGTLSIEDWHGRFAAAGRVDCTATATVCAVRVVGQGDREAWLFPFGAETLKIPPGTRMRVVPGLGLSDAQAEAVLVDWLLELLVLGDGNRLASQTEGTVLVTTRPNSPDCGAPGVRCGVVFEIETAVTGTGLAVRLL